jgi:WD40 repeat protein
VAARPVLLSGGDNGTLRTWDLRTGTEIDKPLHHDGSVTAIGVTELGGRQVLITVSAGHPGHLFYGGTLRVWDLEDHTLVGGPQPIPNSWIKTVAATQLDGRRVAVVAGDGKGGGDPRVVDLAGRSQVGTPTRGHHSRVADLAATTIDERPVLVSAGQDHQLMLWDEKTGQPHELHLDRLPYPVAAVCCAHIGDRPMAAALSYHRLRDGWEIRSWWLPDGEPIGPPITGSGQVFDQFSTEIHTGGAPIVAGSVDGRPTAYTHFRSRVDAWDLRTGQPAGSTDFTELVDTAPLLSAEVTLASLPGNPLAIISHRLGDARDQDSARTALCVYGLHDQELLGRATMQRPSRSPTVTVSLLGPQAVLVAAGDQIHVWDLATGNVLGRAISVPRRPNPPAAVAISGERTTPIELSSLTTVMMDGRRLLAAAAEQEDMIYTWSIDTAELVDSLPIHVGPAALCPTSDDGIAVAAGQDIFVYTARHQPRYWS